LPQPGVPLLQDGKPESQADGADQERTAAAATTTATTAAAVGPVRCPEDANGNQQAALSAAQQAVPRHQSQKQ